MSHSLHCVSPLQNKNKDLKQQVSRIVDQCSKNRPESEFLDHIEKVVDSERVYKDGILKVANDLKKLRKLNAVQLKMIYDLKISNEDAYAEEQDLKTKEYH